jgi:hypothetical protein
MPDSQTTNLMFWAIIVGAAALLVSGYSLWQSRKLGRVYRAFFVGGQELDLEKILLHLNQRLKQTEAWQTQMETTVAQIKETGRGAVQKVGLIRFNPFADSGGNLSFCLALLNDRLDGVVITSIHGRQQNRIYAKNIQGGKHDGGLTEEEMAAIDLANSR